ncbi:hypothetical protein [Azospirillum sp. TSO5]|uniref:hypothetical protein n=1 Tax=Azospirillum sp. TSO5 TaxID=716760 RepID=UPI000D617C8E|nr:hypothetical protein [Azospirillum sp. TSO5]PWC98012.1 hypothetical protein TSO5_03515 [Azospirillum sp. TSO5]
MTTDEPTLFPLDPAPQPKFVYSLNGYNYEADFFADRQQALDAAVRAVTGDTAPAAETAVVYTAIANHAADQHHYPSGDALIGQMSETAIEDGGGEFAEGYLVGVTEEEAQELERDLHAALDRWFARHPRHSAAWFLATEVQRHEVPLGVTLDLLARLVPGQAYRRTDGTQIVYQRHAGDWVHTDAGPHLVTSFLAALDRTQFEEIAP